MSDTHKPSQSHPARPIATGRRAAGSFQTSTDGLARGAFTDDGGIMQMTAYVLHVNAAKAGSQPLT
jgi:hypothetical protein